MIPREILKKIRQIELRTNRLMNASARCVELRIPTGFRLKAQGCEARATLGQCFAHLLNRNAVAAIPAATSHQLRRNPVGVLREVHSFTQGSFATLGWRPEPRWDSSSRVRSQDHAAAWSAGGAAAGSPRREPWESASEDSPAPSGATDFLPKRSFAPAVADAVGPLTHGSRRGLPSAAAPQLPESVSRVLQPRSISVGRDSKPIEFEGFGNRGEFAIIKSPAGGQMNRSSNPVEFDGINNSAKRHFAWSTV
jgi:hypothetical protein